MSPENANAPLAGEASQDQGLIGTPVETTRAQREVNTLQLPPELTAAHGWLTWRYVQKPSEPKPRKVPYYVRGGVRRGVQGSPEDRAKLATLEAAQACLTRGGMQGVGLAMLPEWGLVALDFDDCFPDGALDPTVAAMIAGTYAERSPSGRGVRAFFRGTLPDKKARADDAWQFGFEVFHAKGFVTVTGDVLEPIDELMGPIIIEIPEAVLTHYEARFGRAVERVPRTEARTEARAASGASIDELRELLKHKDPSEGEEAWHRVLMALNYETGGSEEGLDLADEWSSRGYNYTGRESIESRWRSWSSREHPHPITLASLRVELPASIDDFDTLPTVAARPKVPALNFARDEDDLIFATKANLQEALRCAAFSGARLALDTFRAETMIAPRGTEEWRAFTDADYVRLGIVLEQSGFRTVGRDLIRDAVLLAADDCQFDSAILWLNTLEWDRVPRIERFLSTYFDAVDSPYTRAVSAYLWTALAGRVLEPGCKADMVPILVGPQGIGKSTGVAAMVPAPEHYLEVRLDEDDTDLARKMRGVLIGEIAELRGLQSRELESIKTFITRTHEKWTPKYRELPTTFPRRLVFVGTTNNDEFLADETGNRRWLPVRVGKVNVEGVRADRLQLWAEARELWRLSGGIAYQEAEVLSSAVHGEHVVSDPWEDAIERWLDGQDSDGLGEPDGEPRWSRAVSIEEVLVGALCMDLRQVRMNEHRRVGKILRALGFEKRQVREKSRVKMRWALSTVSTVQAADG